MLPESTFIAFEFLRPLWLLGLILVPLIVFIKHKTSKKSIRQPLIAAHLSKQLVTSTASKSGKHWLFPVIAMIACIALSGPSFRSLEMPVYEMQKAQVLVLDLSYSMYATDIKPNRLSQAKYKAIDIIKQWNEGEKALIAYAGDAFTISPLTLDGNSIINHIPHLSPDIMPVTGARADIALDKAISLLKNANYTQGHIVFISDDIDESTTKKMLQQLEGTNWIVSILAVATKDGAAIELADGSLLKNQQGEIVIPQLFTKEMHKITRTTDGLFLTVNNNNSDVHRLGRYFQIQDAYKSQGKKSGQNTFSIDDGYWLAFLLLPLFLLLFRKGLLYVALLGLNLSLLSPPQAQASIWKNEQQNAFHAYQQQNYEVAADLYDDPNAKGSALYKNKQYQQALEQFTQATIDNPDNASAFYNQGNAHAQLKDFDKAIAAYQQALQLNPALQQAKDNKKLLEELIKQQQNEQQSEQQKNEQQQNEQQQNEQQQNEQQQNEQQQNEQQQNEQQQNEQQQNEQQQNEQQQNEQQQNEQQQDEQQQSEQQQNEQQQNEQQQDEQQQSEQQQSEQQQLEQEQQVQKLQEPAEINQELEDLPMWLKNMPDDPSLLLRNKMRLEYQKRAESKPVKRQNNGDIW